MNRTARTRTRTTAARLLAASLVAMIAPRAIGSPADIVAMSAPDIGGEAPKAQDIADGDVSTSMQTGALQYSYPIAVPPGRLGLQPKLGLSYSSQSAIYGGIAAGWTLSGLPEIKWDGSRGIGDREWTDAPRSYHHYISDLAGGRPLIDVTAFEQRNAAADMSFRAQNDSSYARYERLVESQDAIWRVLESDGTTHYFGEGSRITGADAAHRLVRAPITRSVDQFGNTIEYLWSFAADEYRIDKIKYTSNPSQSLARFAEVRFTYVPATLCWSDTKVGAQESFRLTHRFVDGASKLTTITAVAMDPTQFDVVKHTRTITLGYDAATENCNANAATPATHAPYRQLLSIQESAFGPDAPLVSLPPVSFTYGSASLDRSVQLSGVDWSDAMDHPYNLGWGYRYPGETWPSVNAMMLDIDGDGLVDRLTSRPSPSGDRCLTDWARNRGGGSFDPMPPISMPVLPWKNGTGGPTGLGQRNETIAELCALNYQRTKRRTNDAGTGGPLDGAYLIYRWIDMDNDGLPDLVTAIQHSDKYNPNHAQEPAPFGPWPSCSGDESACVAPNAACTTAAYICDQGPDCELDEAAFDACMAEADAVSCDLVIYLDNGDGPSCMQRDGGLSAGPCDDLPDQGADTTLMVPHKKCSLFPWQIYKNLGRGQLSATAEIKLQPAPLESFNGESPMRAGGFAAGSHAVQDLDGDGYVDLVLRGRFKSSSEDDLPPYWWWIFPGDGKGGFIKDGATGNYLMKAFVVPLAAWPSVDYSHTDGDPFITGDSISKAIGQLGDINGDGLTDYFWREPLGPGSGIRSFSNAMWSFRHAFTGDVTGPNQIEISRTRTDESMMSIDRKFIIEGWRTAGVRRLDLDDDGRIDVYSSPHDAPSTRPVYFNTGGAMTQLGSPLASNMAAAVSQAAYATQSAASYIWEAKTDFADLDGDGIPEAISWNGTQMVRWGRAKPTEPPRLMTTVSNGRGLVTSVKYASTNDQTVVNNDPFDGTATPSTQWVVASIETKDSFAVHPETTTYSYNDPWFGVDDEDRYSFRGFKEVKATNPSGSTTTERYAFDIDWSGRLVSTIVAQADGTVTSIKDTTWAADAPLFTGADVPQVTYHPTVERSWTCRAGASEASCRATPAGMTRADTTWSLLRPAHWNDGLLYVATRQTTQDGEAYDAGDRATLTTFGIVADANSFRVRETRVESVLKTSGSDQTFRRTDKTWDSDLKTLTLETAYLEASITASTKREYDATGQVIRIWKPEQYAANTVFTTITYDANKRFAIQENNELGHQVRTVRDHGTGAVIAEIGPNSRSCGTGCPSDPSLPSSEGKRTTIDGLGRPLVIEVTRAHPDNEQAYQWAKVETFSYVDTASVGTPTSVTNKKVIAFDTTRETTTRTDMDGHGRPFKSVESVNGTAPNDAITSYVYGPDGKLISVTVPDPSVNTAARVTFDYTFDSIGRPIGIRRPDATVAADRSGSDISYDGLIETRTEVVGAGGGTPAKTQLETDVFGRLAKVREYTSNTAFSETVYSFSPADEVVRIVDPEGVTTELVHDMGGRRTSIRRGARVWTYAYDKNGNLRSEIAPYDAALPGEELKYTSTFAYDALDRMTSRTIGPRGLNEADVNLFGARLAVYDWDDPAYNRIGRLAAYEAKGTSGPAVYTSTFRYDPQGNATEEKRAWGIPVGTGSVVFPLRGETYRYEANGRLDKLSFADGIDSGEAASIAYTDYDNRGNPVDLRLARPGMSVATVAVQTRNVAGLVTKRRTVQSGAMTSLESNWTYDKLGRVLDQSVIKNDVTGSPVVRQTLGYQGNDDPKFLDHSIGTNRKRFEYLYDKRHQLTKVLETVAGNAFSASYSFGPAGRFKTAHVVPTNLTGREARPRNVTYLYSGTDPEQLTELRSASGSYAKYTYDSAGNQITRTYYTDAALPNPGTLATPQTWTFTYDGDDQLRRVVTPGPLSTTEEYWYDDSGQRALIRTKPPSGPITWRSFYDNTEAEWQTDNASDLTPTLTKTYANAALGTPVARITNRNDSTELQFHGLGSSTLAAIETGHGLPSSGAGTPGAVNAAFFYSPFGEIIETTGLQLSSHRRRMNDKYQDASSGLGYYGYRYYDNTAMTWTQADPLFRFAPDAAFDVPRHALLYTFTLNNPLSYIDPDGRMTHKEWMDQFQGGTDLLDVLESVVVATVTIAVVSTGVGLLVLPFVTVETAVSFAGGTAIVMAGGMGDGEGAGLMAAGCASRARPRNTTATAVATETASATTTATAATGKPVLSELASQIREAGDHYMSVNRRTVAVGRTKAGKLVAAGSNGLDRGQKAAAKKLGVEPVAAKKSKHAEETLMERVDDLEAVGTSKRAPCGPTEHDCAGKLRDAGIEVE